MKNKPVIAVTRPDKKIDITRIFFRLILFMAGAKSIFLTPRNKEYSDHFDALILSGGTDVEPSHYNEILDNLITYDVGRDNFEFEILKKTLNKQKPVMGICRGMQIINIHFGGTLFTDLKKTIDALYLPESFWAKCFYRKKIYTTGKSFLNKKEENKIYIVNSIHHQSVKDLGSGLRVVARDSDNIVQAIEKDGDKIYGVQWHPEYLLFRRDQREIIQRFIAKIE